MDKKFALFLVSLLVLGSTFVYFSSPKQRTDNLAVEKFSSADEFKSYIENSPQNSGYTVRRTISTDMAMESTSDEAGGSASPDRVSKTNVQEKGIDEPDILKTDGKSIFFSPNQWKSETKIIDALPAKNVSLVEKVEDSGQMLLYNNILVIFSSRKISGYNISDREDPEEEWKIGMNGSLVGARLKDNEIYLTVKDDLNHYNPCPVRPLTDDGGKAVEVACTDIYRPVNPTAVDVTYHTFTVETENGEINDRVSFVGSERNSVVYQSDEAIYVTSTEEMNEVKIIQDFLRKEGEGLLPERTIDRIEKVMNYNLSSRAKEVEVEFIIDQHMSSLSPDKRRELESELNNKREEYMKNNIRELETTTITKIKTDDLKVEATGKVPGRPLNQFSMDEENGKLRIATTVGEWDNSENDVYILDEELEKTGSVQGLGETERIYAVRFMGDKGYVVTYRKIDPFYILDLSDPSSPTKEGQLKIPGYSSYLHPLSNDTILGIGEEDGKVKMSVFDVSDVENPEEIDKYSLDEYWSDISRTHRAFLMDKKHGIFFLPANQGGYIFSYKKGLELEKAISMGNTRRALYINDNLYILSDEEMVVLDEENWERVSKLEFEDYDPPVIREKEISRPEV